jgi:IS1 family transposase
LCIRFSPWLWLWSAVSHRTQLVLGFVIDDRTDTALNRLLEEELHPAWRDVPIKTDGWEAYRRLLPLEQHEVCAKASGKTSIAEALNCNRRMRAFAVATAPIRNRPPSTLWVLRRLLAYPGRRNRALSYFDGQP